MIKELIGAALAIASLLCLSARAGPIVITQGGWYVGIYESDDPAIPAIEIQTQEPVYIYHSIITAAGVGISTTSPMVNLGVYDCYALAKPGARQFLYGSNVQWLQVSDCCISGWSFGVYVNNPQGSPYTGAVIRIIRNSGKNNNHFIQLVNLIGVTGEIAWNQDITDVECDDQINLYGTTSPTSYVVHDNYVQGPVTSGTEAGILTDGYPPVGMISRNIHIADNQVVNASFNGITLAYSQNCSASGNRVTASNQVSYGVGMQAYLCDATNVIGPDNLVRVNGLAYGPPSSGTYINNQTTNSSPISESDIWQQKLQTNSIRVGPGW